MSELFEREVRGTIYKRVRFGVKGDMFRFGYVAIKMTKDMEVVQMVQYNGWFYISKILRSKISAGGQALAISHSIDVSNTHGLF